MISENTYSFCLGCGQYFLATGTNTVKCLTCLMKDNKKDKSTTQLARIRQRLAIVEKYVGELIKERDECKPKDMSPKETDFCETCEHTRLEHANGMYKCQQIFDSDGQMCYCMEFKD